MKDKSRVKTIPASPIDSPAREMSKFVAEKTNKQLLRGRFSGSTTEGQITVNSEIFARVLFSRNFAYAKFHENKILAKWSNHSVFY